MFLTQNSKIIYTEYIANNLFESLGVLGGFTGLIYLIHEFITSGYAQFTHEKSVFKRLYSQEDTETPLERETTGHEDGHC
jgi:hypothetical protein